jgi:hypothetical protein
VTDKEGELEIRRMYDEFNTPVTAFDCGEKCAPHNPSGKPFCCDICHAVPAVYLQEWDYLRPRTDLWHAWRGDECPEDPAHVAELREDTPDSMLLLACLGPDRCQRNFRALGCRQFPFFPYISSDLAFIGMAYEWEFEETCWVISHLETVTDAFRMEFIRAFQDIFSLWDGEFESYLLRSEDMRDYFSGCQQKIPLLLNGGGYALLDPVRERLQPVTAEALGKFGPYR